MPKILVVWKMSQIRRRPTIADKKDDDPMQNHRMSVDANSIGILFNTGTAQRP